MRARAAELCALVRRFHCDDAGFQGNASVICRASNSAVGYRVTSNRNSYLLPWPRTRNANKRSKVSVGTTHTSMAAIASALLRRNVFQVCEGGFHRHIFGDRRLGHLKAKHQKLAVGSGMRPKVGFPGSSSGSDRAGHDQSSVALPYFAISNAKTF